MFHLEPIWPILVKSGAEVYPTFVAFILLGCGTTSQKNEDFNFTAAKT